MGRMPVVERWAYLLRLSPIRFVGNPFIPVSMFAFRDNASGAVCCPSLNSRTDCALSRGSLRRREVCNVCGAFRGNTAERGSPVLSVLTLSLVKICLDALNVPYTP